MLSRMFARLNRLLQPLLDPPPILVIRTAERATTRTCCLESWMPAYSQCVPVWRVGSPRQDRRRPGCSRGGAPTCRRRQRGWCPGGAAPQAEYARDDLGYGRTPSADCRGGPIFENATVRIESAIAVRSVRHGISAARYDDAETRVRVAEVLAEISEEFYDVVEGSSATDEHAEYMEARADALDELVEMRVLPSAGRSRILPSSR